MAHQLHGERAAAAAGALGVGIGDAEAALVEVVVKIDCHAAQVEQASLVDDDRNPQKLEGLVQLGVDLRIEIELVLEAAAAAADDAHSQVQSACFAGSCLVGNDLLDFASGL